MTEVAPRILLFMLDPLPDGSYALGKPSLELDREDAAYLQESDERRTERVRFAPGDQPQERSVVVRKYGPNLEWVYIKAETVTNPTENPDGTLTRRGMEIVHLYAVRWVERFERDLTLEREHPELAGSFYDVRVDPSYAREQAIPIDDDPDAAQAELALGDPPTEAPPNIAPLETRWAIKQAVTWRIVAELFRRHSGQCALRVFETHPCDGMYDCVTLALTKPHKSICNFNVASEHFHPTDPVVGRPRQALAALNWPEGNNYVHATLRAPDVITVLDGIADVLGLAPTPQPLPPSTPAVVCLRVAAAYLAQVAFDRETFEMRSGWYDSSEMYSPSGPTAWVGVVPEVAAALEALPEDAPWEDTARFAGRLWRLQPVKSDRGVVFDLVTGIARPVVSAKVEGTAVSLFDEYRRDRSIPRLVSLVAAMMPKAAPVVEP